MKRTHTKNLLWTNECHRNLNDLIASQSPADSTGLNRSLALPGVETSVKCLITGGVLPTYDQLEFRSGFIQKPTDKPGTFHE